MAPSMISVQPIKQAFLEQPIFENSRKPNGNGNSSSDDSSDDSKFSGKFSGSAGSLDATMYKSQGQEDSNKKVSGSMNWNWPSSQKKEEMQLVLRSPLKRPKFTVFKTIKYPSKRVYNKLKMVRPLKNLSKAVRILLWKSVIVEEYKAGQLINNGKLESDIDFLYVLEGSIVYKLERREV